MCCVCICTRVGVAVSPHLVGVHQLLVERHVLLLGEDGVGGLEAVLGQHRVGNLGRDVQQGVAHPHQGDLVGLSHGSICRLNRPCCTDGACCAAAVCAACGVAGAAAELPGSAIGCCEWGLRQIETVSRHIPLLSDAEEPRIEEAARSRIANIITTIMWQHPTNLLLLLCFAPPLLDSTST